VITTSCATDYRIPAHRHHATSDAVTDPLHHLIDRTNGRNKLPSSPIAMYQKKIWRLHGDRRFYAEHLAATERVVKFHLDDLEFLHQTGYSKKVGWGSCCLRPFFMSPQARRIFPMAHPKR
jgi:hypothetical protein